MQKGGGEGGGLWRGDRGMGGREWWEWYGRGRERGKGEGVGEGEGCMEEEGEEEIEVRENRKGGRVETARMLYDC